MFNQLGTASLGCFRIYRETLSRFSCAASIYAKLHLSSQSVLIETAKNILNINKLVPIYINAKTILFPLKHKRAPIQIYINAHYIVGMTAIENSTLIHFQEGIQLEVDEPFSLVSKKCHESLALKHFIENTISN
ncbi:competence protein ComK [Staphylococcus aureus]